MVKLGIPKSCHEKWLELMLSKLYRNMSLEEFEKGYFYAAELKAFAKKLGIDVGTLRKNEVELFDTIDQPVQKNYQEYKKFRNKTA
jgi:hypothetical protein